jgi:enoyl-[acyl-carrier protein] reductase/trans-2-enoyl-CoA reductase (NAD+)
MQVKPKIRGYICTTAHPEGCALNVQHQIQFTRSRPAIADGPKKVLVIGASTGYGLASRITAAFGSGAATVGVFFEKPAEEGRTASAGWYNSVAFEEQAHKAGLFAKSINGDAFSDQIKQQVIQLLQETIGAVDLVIYSLASPRRTDPKTGLIHKSTLKPIGESFSSKNLDTDKKLITEINIDPATQEEVYDTIKVMGGEDWELWIDALKQNNLLAPGFKTVAYTYIGPKVTWPIYRNGTIGKAKENLEHACNRLKEKIRFLNGQAFISVNKAVVTQASSAIPVVPLYVSILFGIMKDKNLHEGCIEQIQRLFSDHLYNAHGPKQDELGRIRLDDLEMRPDIQEAVNSIWPEITTDQLDSLTDFKGYQKEFLKLFGFGFESIDYEADVAVDKQLEI